jgi:hypothetical protein
VPKSEGIVERSFLNLVSRISGWAVTGLGLLLYVGAGLVLSLTLRWRTVFLIEANVLGTVPKAPTGAGPDGSC